MILPALLVALLIALYVVRRRRPQILAAPSAKATCRIDLNN